MGKHSGSCNKRSGYVKFCDRLTESDKARFWAKVDRKGDGECWLWTAARMGGRPGTGPWYGQFGWQESPGVQRHLYAHRVAYTLCVGEVPENLMVLHTCDVPQCVNPAHLFVGTHLDNMRDAASKGRLHVPRPRRQTVPDAAVSQIRARRAAGEKLAPIAADFGVTQSFVSFVARGLRRSA